MKRSKKENPLFRFTDEIGRLSTRHREERMEASLLDPDPILSQPLARPSGPTVAVRRFRVAFIFLSVVVVLFVARAAHLQLLTGGFYREIAEGNRFRVEVIPATRGTVTDRFGDILIENVPAFSLVMHIARIPTDETQRQDVFDRVADLAGLQRTDLDLLLQEYANTPREDVVVEKDLDYTNAMITLVEEYRLPGFSVEILTKRQYNSRAPSLSHTLGYMGKMSVEEYEMLRDAGYLRTDEIGKAGVEKSLESVLRGTPGKKLIEVDAYGAETTIYAETTPVNGSDVTLSLDLELQVELEKRLLDTLAITGTQKASAVVMDPRTGEILALVSLPAFDSNVFAKGIDTRTYAYLTGDPNEPLFPRAIAGEFPSGSTFKPFVAAAALAEGLISETTSVLSVGGISVGPWFFPDWKPGGHGITDVRKAIAESVNTFFYTIGGGYNDFQGLGVERITTYARAFGFGSPTGIDLPGETDGFLPSKKWKEETKGERWYVGDTYHLAIGQGDILVTPIQMAVGTATIANGGTRWAPSVVRAVNGLASAHASVELSDDLKRAIAVVSEGMRQTVTQGSARGLNALPFAVAGKTGTAQTGGDEPTHAWFTGFGPYEDPEIVITILIERGGEGSSVAVPIAKDLFAWWEEHRRAR